MHSTKITEQSTSVPFKNTSEQMAFGRGIIRISNNTDIFDDDFRSPLAMTDTQGELRDKGVFDRVHARLLLPEGYKILGIYFQPWSLDLWHIVVESSAIPVPQEGEMLPQITLTYQQIRDEYTVRQRLEGIKIERYKP